MTSWVLAIDSAFPDHWDIAKQHGFWDLRTPHRIQAGDVVYFWRSGESFAGRVEVVSGVRNLGPMDVLPWHDRDTTQYRQRFTFTNPTEPVTRHVRWSEIKQATGWRQGPNWAPHTDDSTVERILRGYFQNEAIDEVSAVFSDVPDAVQALGDITLDERRRTLAEIAVRRGQGRFRTDLIAAYKRCAVTGTATESVLEAAHISPYRGDASNDVRNGLLLRSDIHTLFDLFLLAIDVRPNGFVVRVASEITEQHYRDLDGALLVTLPADSNMWPDAALLARHRERCVWMSA